jgi:ATP-binding cassette, subfamily B, bacterial
METSTSKLTLRLYWEHAKKYKGYLWKFLTLMITTQAAEEVIAPLLISRVLTQLSQGNIGYFNTKNLTPVFVAIFAAEAYHIFLNKIVVRWVWTFEELVMRDLLMTSFKHLTSMSYNFFSNRFGGSLVSQVNKFVGSFERLSDAMIWNVFRLIIGYGFTIAILLPKVPQVVAAIIFFTILFIPLSWRLRQKQIPYNQRWAAAETNQTGQLADTITNILAVKSFAGESRETKRMRKRANDVVDRSLETMKLVMHHEHFTSAVQRAINLSVIIFSIWLAMRGYAAVGVVYLSLTYTSNIMRQLWDLSNTFRQLTRVFGDAHEMTQILLIAPEVTDPKEALAMSASEGEVTFRNATFGYSEKITPLFDNLSLHIAPGEKIGLVGPSGGGKTTITKLLLRFLDLQSGVIEIDGQDIASVKQTDLREHIAYVQQEPLLFHRSLADNISYGKPDASMVEIIEASKKAHAHDFIEELPLGYDTLVGERGVKLSGGQRQRVAIARAMLKDAPLLVLDEATSALDSESEVLIQKALWKLMEGRTAIVIAHRLSTIQKMDRILVLDNGKIVEEGTHTELLKHTDGLYAKLWQHQSGGFLQD